MVSILLEHIANEFKRIQPAFSDFKFVKPLMNRIVDEHNVYAGIVDNKGLYGYIRIINHLGYNTADKVVSCAHISDFSVNISARIVVMTFADDNYRLDEAIRQTLYRLDFSKPEIQSQFMSVNIALVSSNLYSDIVAKAELGDTFKFGEMNIVSTDLTINYRWAQPAKCDFIDLCDKPIKC